MKQCPRCPQLNDESVDFCVRCGEFLDWGAEAGNGSHARTTSAVAQTARIVTVTPRGTEQVVLDVFRPDQPDEEGPVEVRVPAGGRVTIGARVSNESDIVDAYQVAVHGLDDGWYTIAPPVVYLMPSPSDGHTEDVEIAVHPPRTPPAAAGRRAFEVVVTSQSDPTRTARATVFVDVEPFWQIEAAAIPETVTSRRRATLDARVSNTGNAPVPVVVKGRDMEDRCRVEPRAERVPVLPSETGTGEPASIGLDVRAKRPHVIGRPREHRLELQAADADGHAPSVAFFATFRQRAWLPWWLPLVLLLLAIAALVAYLLWPHHVKVPDLVKLPSAFAAQQKLEQEGLTLNPRVRRQPRRDVKPGSVVDQAPDAGTHVDKGKAVSVVVASRPGKVKVPKVTGMKVTAADQRLQKAGLTLGAVVPRIEPNGRVGGQVPQPGVKRGRGSPVNVTLGKPKKPAKAKKAAAAGGAKPVPAVAGGGAAAAAAALSKAGLTPVTKVVIDPAKRGTVIATTPAEGKPPPADGIVTLTVSAGFPKIAYDDGSTVFAVGGVAGRPVMGVAGATSATTTGGAWSPDGRRVAYVRSGRIFLRKLGAGGRPGRVGIGSGKVATQVAFAPSHRRTILAFADHSGSGGDSLCWLDVTGGTSRRLSCKGLPGWRVDGIAWRPGGKQILAPATGGGRFGLLSLETKVGFSTVAEDWTGGSALATPDRPGHGVLAAAFSPDGKHLALVANLDTDDFRLVLAKPDDLKLKQKPKQLPVPACDVAWRSDSAELAVVQSGARCVERVGSIVRLRPDAARSIHTVALLGQHPSWQPVSLNLAPGP